MSAEAAPFEGVKFDGKEGAHSSLWLSLTLLAIFLMVWTAYGVISASPASIHNDMAEAYVWGREFQLGYEKHPPSGLGSRASGLRCFPALIGHLPFSRCSMLLSAFMAPGCS